MPKREGNWSSCGASENGVISLWASSPKIRRLRLVNRFNNTKTQRHKDTKTQRHKDTKTQRHKENALKGKFERGFFVSLCLCVFLQHQAKNCISARIGSREGSRWWT